MKKIFMLVSVLGAMVLMASGCSNGSASTQAPQPPQTPTVKVTADYIVNMVDRLPPMPDEAANNTTLAGIDANNNGVRDDVEHFIAQKFAGSAKQRAVAMQEAAIYQRVLSVQTQGEAKQFSLASARMISCYRDYVGEFAKGDQIDQVLAVIINSVGRAKAYNNYERLLAGTVLHGDDIDGKGMANCDINLGLLPN